MSALPIVLVHGIRLSGAMWTEQRKLLSDRHPVLTPDLPGHGRRRGERFTLAGAIAAVTDAIDEAGGRALVAGLSLGGYVAVATAGHHPQRVAGLVAAGCTLRPSPALRTPFLLAHRGLTMLPDNGDRLSQRTFRRVLPAQVSSSIIKSGIATEVIPDVMSAAAGFDPIVNLAAYPGPAWIVNGRHDHFRLQEKRFHAAKPDAELIVAPHAGHYFPMTHGQQFAQILLAAARAAESAQIAAGTPGKAAKTALSAESADPVLAPSHFLKGHALGLGYPAGHEQQGGYGEQRIHPVREA